MAVSGLPFTGITSIRAGASLRWYDSDEAHYSALAAPSHFSTDISYTLPTGPPSSNGQMLVGTTGGVLSWATPPSASATENFYDGGEIITTGTEYKTIISRFFNGLTAFQISMIAFSDSGLRKGLFVAGVWDGASAELVEDTYQILMEFNDPGFDLGFLIGGAIADTAKLALNGTGAAGETVHWKATMKWVEF